MAKSLGQIHNVNSRAGPFTGVNQRYNIDLPGELTSQLQRMVRAGTFHKLVGIDITVDPSGLGPTQGGQVSGTIKYYLPTRGRCAAFRGAFKSMAEVMKTQGITMRDNELYDFKAPLNSDAVLNPTPMENQATLNGTDGLCLYNTAVPGASIFDVHNASVQPAVYSPASGVIFQEGFDTLLQGPGGTDFVLNDAVPYTGNHDTASLSVESIPFTCSYEPATATSSASTVKFSFRPDPALYIAILCGQMQIVIDEINLTGGATSVVLNVSSQVSGWKSIMGNPDKKPRKKKKVPWSQAQLRNFANRK